MIHGPRLLIRLGSLGDVVLSTAVANLIRERTEDPLDVLVKEEWAPVWKNHPAIRHVHCLTRKNRGPRALMHYARLLRRETYVEIIDLQGSFRTRVLTGLARQGSVRRPERYGRERRRLVRTKEGGPPEGFTMLQAFLDCVAPNARTLPSVHPGQTALIEASQLLRGCSSVALVPNAMHPTKRWPVERFAVLGQRIYARDPGKPVPVLWGPGDDVYERAFRSVWPQDDQWISIRKPLESVAAVLQQVSVVVTNDTGLMHLAASVGTRVLALFGPTVPAFGFSPAGEGHVILERDLPCRPCSLHGGKRCPELHFRCMLDQTVGEVEEALQGMRA